MKITRLPRTIAMLLTLAAVAMFFLPFVRLPEGSAAELSTAVSAAERTLSTKTSPRWGSLYAEEKKNAEEALNKLRGIFGGDPTEFSLWEYSRFTVWAAKYEKLVSPTWKWSDNLSAVLAIALSAAPGVLAVLAFLSAWWKKPLGVLGFGWLWTGACGLMYRSLLRGSGACVSGIAHTLALPLGIAMTAAAIWLWIARSIYRKRRREERRSRRYDRDY